MAAVHGLDDLTFIAAKSIRPDERAGWSAWLAESASAHGGALWRLLDPGPAGRPGAGHTHVVHLPTDRVAAFAAATARARKDGSAGSAHAETRRDDWTRAEPGSVDDTAPVTGLVVAEVMCADPDRVDEWDAWYDAEHLPDMMAAGAFVAGTRWRRRVPRPSTPDHLTVYEVAGHSVEDAVEMSAAVMPDLVARGRKHPFHTGGLTWALELVR